MLVQVHTERGKQVAYHTINDQPFEVFYLSEQECKDYNDNQLNEFYETAFTPGYYYAFGFPGYLHDSDPFGPFDSEEECIKDAESVILDY